MPLPHENPGTDPVASDQTADNEAIAGLIMVRKASLLSPDAKWHLMTSEHLATGAQFTLCRRQATWAQREIRDSVDTTLPICGMCIRAFFAAQRRDELLAKPLSLPQPKPVPLVADAVISMMRNYMDSRSENVRVQQWHLGIVDSTETLCGKNTTQWKYLITRNPVELRLPICPSCMTAYRDAFNRAKETE